VLICLSLCSLGASFQHFVWGLWCFSLLLETSHCLVKFHIAYFLLHIICDIFFCIYTVYLRQTLHRILWVLTLVFENKWSNSGENLTENHPHFSSKTIFLGLHIKEPPLPYQLMLSFSNHVSPFSSYSASKSINECKASQNLYNKSFVQTIQIMQL
jgi:hypothetical protein